MKLVADANVLFSFFKKESTTRELISNFRVLELYTPSFSIDELTKYKQLICEKSDLSESEFKETLNNLLLFVQVVPISEYADLLIKAKDVSPDPDDIDFFALALKLDCAIWSNESKLKKQTIVQVFTTKELVELLGL